MEGKSLSPSDENILSALEVGSALKTEEKKAKLVSLIKSLAVALTNEGIVEEDSPIEVALNKAFSKEEEIDEKPITEKDLEQFQTRFTSELVEELSTMKTVCKCAIDQFVDIPGPDPDEISFSPKSATKDDEEEKEEKKDKKEKKAKKSSKKKKKKEHKSESSSDSSSDSESSSDEDSDDDSDSSSESDESSDSDSSSDSSSSDSDSDKKKKKEKMPKGKVTIGWANPTLSGVTLKKNVLTWSSSTTGMSMLKKPVKKGIWKFEFMMKDARYGSWTPVFGIAVFPRTYSPSSCFGHDSQSMAWYAGGSTYQGGTSTSGNETFQDGDRLGMEINMKKKMVIFFKDKKRQRIYYTGIPKVIVPGVGLGKVGATVTLINMRTIHKFSFKKKSDDLKLVWR
ncbi:uncharacterized protein MONOS_15145 [Monocercomonoides exilis]|uniref:uncharacterized protein n=1 Tax=Monocercomonoides exilis TaxID=2049356 RepID=UPI00355989D1|nr:hypothetical protein MONOS_15145 [Monocercomonoides exilis]|eukprot:MONOS_15145.1-p1 / transcript=MONOS_15145.1 / gene=MONOS_15145 / organism=Monocercomonoides_exilis_PA203 / gene_product=unspecified product / transcript_product=unspecified product / location=Mono_scaffold01154:12651-14369(-) / protein_length=396 / sequence_SO=supercontig / SO=protein_coding / is_pseudo=false